ncbi:MAG: hypothetical protein QW548_01385 [Candidatus Aenigmatarchaeota archaeon]
MKPAKVLAALVKDEPLNIDERLEKLERETNMRFQQFEEALGVFKDLVVKLHDEKERLQAENASLRESLSRAAVSIKDAVAKPLVDAGEQFIELLADSNNGHQPGHKVLGNPNHVGYDPNSDEVARTIAWMREKFGLPPAQKAVRKAKTKRRG